MTQRDELESRVHSLGTDVVLGARTGSSLIDVLAREYSEGDRDRRCRDRELGEGPRDRMGEDVEVRGLSSDQAAERHDGIEAARPCEHRDGRRQLERARDLEFLHLRAFGERGLDRAVRQGACDLVIPPCANDRDARARMRVLHPRRSLPTGRHLPQSSPGMKHCLVSG
jgi:hypothetical protein